MTFLLDENLPAGNSSSRACHPAAQKNTPTQTQALPIYTPPSVCRPIY